MRRLRTLFQPALAAIHRHLAEAHTRLYLGTSGQGLVEYGLLLVLIMVVCVGIIGLMGNTVSQLWYGRIMQTFPH
jgi:Flp pilus assembly pilin Flp